MGVVIAAAAMLFCATPSSAEPFGPGCDLTPSLNAPVSRTICDSEIQSDGSWMRARSFHYLSTASDTPAETYRVTPDTIPPGEPGHLD